MYYYINNSIIKLLKKSQYIYIYRSREKASLKRSSASPLSLSFLVSSSQFYQISQFPQDNLTGSCFAPSMGCRRASPAAMTSPWAFTSLTAVFLLLNSLVTLVSAQGSTSRWQTLSGKALFLLASSSFSIFFLHLGFSIRACYSFSRKCMQFWSFIAATKAFLLFLFENLLLNFSTCRLSALELSSCRVRTQGNYLCLQF